MMKRSKLKILLVEDSLVSQMVVLTQLRKLGYEAYVAENGQEALSRLAQIHFDIVLIDCQMPVLDGYDTTQKIRHLEGIAGHTIVIAITTNGKRENREKCLNVGMNDYLIKPVSLEKLADKLEQWTQAINWARNAFLSDEDNFQSATLANSEVSKSLQINGIVDLQRLNDIALGNITLQKEVLKAFIQDTQKNLATIRTAIFINDFVTVARKAHQIKGSSANVGVSCMQAIADQLESQAQTKDLRDAIDLWENLQNYLECLQSFLFRILQDKTQDAEKPLLLPFSQAGYSLVPYMAKILIIDDDPSVRLVIKHSLQLLGHEVAVASDGEEGLLKAHSFRPNLIICDWIMPIADGLEVCRKIKSDPELCLTFFILLTIRGDIKDRVEGLDTGADEYLPKPIDMSELRARVRAGLRSHRLTQELREANQALIQANQQLTARNELLESLSLTDQLTGLLNRRAMDQALTHMLRQVGNREADTRYRYLCLFLMDIDHFKQVNDTHGHTVGDTVLQGLAARLQSNARHSSLLYRYGGEEFVCITLGLNPQTCLEYGEALRSVIASDPIQVSDDLAVSITISIGGTIASTSNLVDTQELLHQADCALYQAKRDGRDCLRMFSTVDTMFDAPATNRYV